MATFTEEEVRAGEPVVAPLATSGVFSLVGDEGLERFSHEPIKHEFLDQPSKQVVANAVANPTLSETVAQLINCWDNMCPEERAVLTALLWPNTTNVSQQS
jgi:hypothetical protein